jgi:FkbM family methyltransferase
MESIHLKIKLKYGSLNDELPEQKMAINWLNGSERVLEIGGNIGRNSLVIASILNENTLVVLESDDVICSQLTENRDLNGYAFNVECSALSNRQLIQYGWETIPIDSLPFGCFPIGFKMVNSISFNELQTKYNIKFDTLVLDCEGAFFYILIDMPEILENINLIIMENDYHDIRKKQYVDDVLQRYNFEVVYVEGGGWGPCSDNFYEVWKKTIG